MLGGSAAVHGLTGERTDSRIVDEGVNQKESADSPRSTGIGGRSDTDEADDHERDEDSSQTR